MYLLGWEWKFLWNAGSPWWTLDEPKTVLLLSECKLEEKTDKESPQSEGEKGSSASKSEPEKGAEKSEKALLKKPEGLTVDVPRDPSGVLPEPL